MILYFLAIIIGLTITILEWRHATRVHHFLVENKLNGARQMLAKFSMREEGVRVLVLLVLLGSAIAFFIRSHDPLNREEWLHFGRALHLIAITLISVKSWMCRQDRITLMALLHAEARYRDTLMSEKTNANS